MSSKLQLRWEKCYSIIFKQILDIHKMMYTAQLFYHVNKISVDPNIAYRNA